MRRLLWVFAVALCWARAASATPVTVHFAGTIDALDAPDYLGGTGVGLGTPFSGYYSLDTAGAVHQSGSLLGPGVPDFFQLATPLAIHAEIAGVVIDTRYDKVFDGVLSGTTPLIPAGSVVWQPFRISPELQPLGFDAIIAFGDTPPARTPEQTLSPVSSLDGWDVALFFFAKDPSAALPTNPNLAHGTLHITVPEPSALALLLLAGLALRRASAR